MSLLLYGALWEEYSVNTLENIVVETLPEKEINVGLSFIELLYGGVLQ